MKRFVLMVACAALSSLYACSSNSNNATVQKAIDYSLATSESTDECIAIWNVLVVGNSFIDGDKIVAPAIYKSLAEKGWVTTRPATPDDQFGDDHLGGRAPSYRTWVFTASGDKMFPKTAQNPDTRWFCPLTKPHVARVVSDVPVQESPNLHTVTVDLATDWQSWVPAEARSTLGKTANWQNQVAAPTSKSFTVDESQPAAPKVVQ